MQLSNPDNLLVKLADTNFIYSGVILTLSNFKSILKVILSIYKILLLSLKKKSFNIPNLRSFLTGKHLWFKIFSIKSVTKTHHTTFSFQKRNYAKLIFSNIKLWWLGCTGNTV